MKKNSKQKTVLLALSGGVDSSVAALLLKKQGYRVIAAFMKNFSDTKNPLTGECNYLEDKKMAQKIASILNLPFEILDFEKQYKKQVIEPMFKAYKKGLTPNPDILCNKIIKFPLLWKIAKKIKTDYIATGHYARIRKTKLGYSLLMGKDKTKDQSYFLSELSQNDLQHTLFPIGNLTKTEVRKIAKKNNFPNWNKKSTSGICFVGKINFKSFLEKKIKNKNGLIKDPNNNVIGKHPGIFYFTIGQRIGQRLGIKFTTNINKKLYVAKKIKSKNIIIATPENSPLLKKQKIKIINFHKINEKEKIPKLLKARIRHLGHLHKGKLIKKNYNYYFVFNKPIEQVAEGQYIVLYYKNKVMASGEIR